MAENKVKKFWNEHKKEIMVGTVASIVGVGVGLLLNRSDSTTRKLLQDMHMFNKGENGNTLLGDICLAQCGANHADVFFGNEVKLANVCEEITKYYTETGVDPEKTMVTGLVMYLKKEK